MRTLFGRLALVWVVLLMAMAPEPASCQGVAPPEWTLPIPLGGPKFRREGTGPFVAFEMLFLEQTNPIRSQDIAFRGFLDVQGGIAGAPGTFVGSRTPALNSNQVNDADSFQPGIALAAGWRFESGTILEVGWWHLADTRYHATASVIPPGFNVGPMLEETFLFSPVFNFATEFAGPLQNVVTGNPGDTFGIWNAASEMTVDFVQRFDQGYLNLRIPIDESDSHRIYGTLGGRALIMWERFKWRTVSRNTGGQAGPTDVGLYTNVVSNRLYGATVGCTYDWYLGSSPLGAFACTVGVEGSLMIDIVKQRAKYELGDFSTAASRAVNEYTFAPVVQGDLSFWWFPYEGIQFRLGWNVLAAFNTVAGRQPVDFNLGAVSPDWESGVTRFLNGFHVGFGFVF